MSKKTIAVISIIMIIFALAVWILVPINGERFGRQGMRLGLDLVGGVHLVYRIDFPDDATNDEKAAAVERALTTIEQRIDRYGVAEPIIQAQENERILVQLPGFADIEEAKALVEKTGFLEFREVESDNEGNLVYLTNYLDGSYTDFANTTVPGSRVFTIGADAPTLAVMTKGADGTLVFEDLDGNPLDVAELQAQANEVMAALPGEQTLVSWIASRGSSGTALTGALLEEALPDVRTGTGVEPQVAIQWGPEGTIIFDEVASRIYSSGPYGSPQRALGIFLDSELISSPQILETTYDGSATITGSFTIEEVVSLASLLQSGALPMPLEKPPLYEEKISATLGANFIDMSLLAGLIGILLVMLFMILYYRLPGFLASLALLFYGAVVLAIFKLVPVTLTLAGIGGFVLSIGMAVDANVLIFERMREELRTGRTVGAAIEAGFNRAWTAIRDSNITTFIVCGILYWLGSSIVASAPVMGFALTLFIGVAVSMFTAIVITRTLLRLTLHTRLSQQRRLFIRETGKD
jgi:protein-export membrane protein SecD